MNLSMKWLKDFVDVDVSAKEYADAMTMSGSKVEGYETEGEEIKNVVVGKILRIEKHPDADKLVVCSVDVGGDAPLQIVTGATNLKQGDLVPVALDGSVLPGGVKIKKGKLRGVESCGMLCSLGELHLTHGDFPYAIEDGIFVLEETCAPGDDIRAAIGLDDTVVEFEITPNRPDCLSVLGLARETAATFQQPLRLSEPVVKEAGGDIAELLSVEVREPELCKRYMARVVKNIRIAPSPRWMRERLRASGVRPINNIVDITNYVMLEYGQPMHAFDLSFVKDGKIVVRRAQEGETITTLDGAQRSLTPDMLVIADAEKPSAVAGVMGGEYSGIHDGTHTIVFESACFAGPSVRNTAKALGMRTDSSARFEKGLDPQNCDPALARACELVNLLGAGEVVSGVIDSAPEAYEPVRIRLDAEWINRFLGVEVSREQMVEILTRLGFGMDGDEVLVPSFRGDVVHKADIAEEIARFYGYDHIPETSIRGVAQGIITPEQQFERTMTQTMLALGYTQILTYSFISPREYDLIGMPADAPERESVRISNPLGEETSIMRTTALPSMLEILAGNYKNRNTQARLFELATEYRPRGEGELPDEPQKLVLGAYGGKADFYTLKGAVEALLGALCVADYDVDACSEHYAFHPGRCAVLTCGGRELGILGEVHPAVCENYGIGTRAYAAVLDTAALLAVGQPEKTYHPLPRFPAVTRDLALLCDADLPVLTLEKAIRKASGKLLERVELFDVYTGSQIPEGKKSVAYTLTLRSAEGTLTDEQCDKVVRKVIAAVEKLGAALRSM